MEATTTKEGALLGLLTGLADAVAIGLTAAKPVEQGCGSCQEKKEATQKRPRRARQSRRTRRTR